MKTFLAVLSIFASASYLSIPQVVSADPSAPAGTNVDPHIEAWAKAATPGEQHALLGRYVGKWNHVVKWWMNPDSKPEVSTGSTVVDLIMDGKFIRQTAKGTSMGRPFEGLGITGFDNIQGHYSSLWIDNMSTAMMAGVGEFDKKSQAIVEKGTFSCPIAPSKKRSYRAVWTTPVKDSYRYDFFSTDDKGKEIKMMEIVYTRAE